MPKANQTTERNPLVPSKDGVSLKIKSLDLATAKNDKIYIKVNLESSTGANGAITLWDFANESDERTVNRTFGNAVHFFRAVVPNFNADYGDYDWSSIEEMYNTLAELRDPEVIVKFKLVYPKNGNSNVQLPNYPPFASSKYNQVNLTWNPKYDFDTVQVSQETADVESTEEKI